MAEHTNTHEETVLHPKHTHAARRSDEQEVTKEEEVTEKTAAHVPPPTRTPSTTPPRVRQTTLTTDLEPERSHFGTYITVGAIIFLLIFGLWQLFSKSGLKRQVNELQRENSNLREQITQLQAQPTPQPLPTPVSVITPPPQPTASTYYPVLYRNAIRQQIGQLITAPTDASIVAITLRGNGGLGDNAELAIFQTDDPTKITETNRPAVSKLFNASQIPVGQPFALQLDKPYELDAGKKYFIVVRPSSTNAQANIGYSAAEAGSGEMWVYTRKVSTTGEVLDTNPSWQMIPNVSLTADLRISE